MARPKRRDVRTLAQRIHILPGDGFAPSRLAETRQRLRSCPLVDRVSLEVVDLPDSVGLRHHPLLLTAALTPLPKRLIRVNGALTSRQGLGGEVKLALSDLDFRQRMERISFDIQTGLETVADFTTEEEELHREESWRPAFIMMQTGSSRSAWTASQITGLRARFPCPSGTKTGAIQPHLHPTGLD